MGLFSQPDANDALEDLLDRERSAVLDGRFDVLERLSSEKERLILAVVDGGASAQTLSRLRNATERNGLLLKAMRSGVVAAQKRLKAMQMAKEPLQTYDASGRKSAMISKSKASAHRA